MIHVRLLIHEITGEILGCVAATSKAPDPQKSSQKHPVVVVQVGRDHRAIYDQEQWHAPKRMILGAAWGRELKHKERRG